MSNVKCITYNSNYTGMVVLHLQKGFDTIVHDFFTTILQAIGIASTEWVKSYFSDRKYLVNVNRVEPKPRGVTIGVPQGNVLRHILFICCVNDISIKLPIVVIC